jgi:hypothetical protein
MLRGVRRSLGLLAAGTILGAGGLGAPAQATAQAQASFPPGAVVQAPDSGAELRRHLADLGANPRNLSSLIGAGRAAVAVGDGNAAIGFFGRAEEIAPRDARVKAGMASAFVLLEQPQAALRFFAEAQQLGAPEQELARDRGLAYDMSGNPRRAQQDYVLVLQRGAEDAETRRRLALSLAISGNREAALATLQPLIQRSDRPSIRTRAFILALTGDASGASQAVDAALPGQGQAMAPFLARLAGLSPAQKAMAVHFGHFPADGRPIQTAQGIDTSALPAAVAMSGAAPAPASRPTTLASAGGRRRVVPQPVNSDPRRRPGEEPGRAGNRAQQQPVRTAAAVPVQQPRRDAGQTRSAAPAAPQQPRRDAGQTRTAAAQPVRTMTIGELQQRNPAVGQPQARAAAPAPAPAPTPAAAPPAPAPQSVFERQQPVSIASSDIGVSNVLTGSPAPLPAPAPQPGFGASPAPAPAAQPVRIASAQTDIPPAMRQDGPPPIPDRSGCRSRAAPTRARCRANSRGSRPRRPSCSPAAPPGRRRSRPPTACSSARSRATRKRRPSSTS